MGQPQPRGAAAPGVPYRGLHLLRKDAGTRMAQSKLTLHDVARHLGHSSIETTQTYAKWADDSLRRALEGWWMGQFLHPQCVRTHKAYDPREKRWHRMADLPTPRHGMEAAVVQEVLYVPTGAPTPGASSSAVNEAFTAP